MPTSGQSRKGELRRRWRALMQAGSFAGLRSEGRLVAIYVLCVADWVTCEVSFSMRRAAKAVCVQPTTIRRGMIQLVEAGVLGVLEKGDRQTRARYVVSGCAHPVSRVDTSGAHPCAQGVRTLDTSGAQGAHTLCPPRTRAVRSLRTRCAHSSVLSSGSPVRTSERDSQADAGAGGNQPSVADEETPTCPPIDLTWSEVVVNGPELSQKKIE